MWARMRPSCSWCGPRRPRAAARVRTRATGGGSDANVFAARGIEIANLGCGMREIHTVNEWVDLKDVVVTAELVLSDRAPERIALRRREGRDATRRS